MTDGTGRGSSHASGQNPAATTVVCPTCGEPIAAGGSVCPRCTGGAPKEEQDTAELIRTRLQDAIGSTYELLELVGRGGMGIVFRAREVALEREVALKVLTLDPILAPEAFTRFEREAKLAARLDHPGIVPIFSVGSGKGIAYYTMRLVRGGTLEELIDERRAMDYHRTIGILREVAAALDYAHARGIVHRDIKPANILLGDTGHAAVADFGIARALEGSSEMTGTAIIGSPGYMSPEQWRGDEVGGRADQYALAVMAFEMLAGRRPFEHPRVQDLMQLHIAGEIPDITTVRSGLDMSVAAAITRALSKSAAERFPTTTAFVEALAGRRRSVGAQRQSRAVPIAEPPKRRAGLVFLMLVALAVGTPFAVPQTRPQALETWQTVRNLAVETGAALAVHAGLQEPIDARTTAGGSPDSQTTAVNTDSLERAIAQMLADTTSTVASLTATPGESRVPLSPVAPLDTIQPIPIDDPVLAARAKGSFRRAEAAPGYAKIQFVGGIARVRIDGRTYGTASITPYVVALDSGRHVVSLFASAYTPLMIELNVLPGDTAAAVFLTPNARAQQAAAKAAADSAAAAPPPTAPDTTGRGAIPPGAPPANPVTGSSPPPPVVGSSPPPPVTPPPLA